jgi:hypothetical protein
LQGPPKLTQIAIFGLKIYHLATLFPGVNVMITIYGDFHKKWRLSYGHFSAKMAII